MRVHLWVVPSTVCGLSQVLIYVFDIESRELAKDIEYYASCEHAPARVRRDGPARRSDSSAW